MDTFLDEEGISHEFSATYTPQQNGVFERKNRTLIKMARTMLDEYKTPKHLWAEAVETACHATNRLYLHKLLGKTAYELLTGNKPQVGYFRVFSSKCYILDKHCRSKFAPMCTSHVASNTQWLVSMGKLRKSKAMWGINAIARYDKDVDEVTVLGDDETLAKMSHGGDGVNRT